MTDNDLKPISPTETREMYLNERREDASYATRQKISETTSLFVDWAETEGIENMNVIRGRELRRFKNWCKTESDNGIVSLNGIMAATRRFMVYCASIEAVGSDVPDKTPVPNVPDDEDVCYDKPTDEEVSNAIRYLRKQEPTSRRRVEYELVEEIGIRMGAARSIDTEDLKLEERVIELNHRPEKSHPDERGTPLKNGSDGERHVNISSDLADLIQDYLDNPDRHEVEDKFGREPLFTTSEGRVSPSTFRRDLYKLTRPCVYSGECPHDRDKDDCEAVNNDQASECPSSHSAHPLRRFSIESQINQGVPKETLVDRVDVSLPVLNKHYDLRSKERKQEHRLKILEKLYPEYGDADATIDIALLEDDAPNDTKSTLEPDLEDVSPEQVEDELANTQDEDCNAVSKDDDGSETDAPQATFDDFSGDITGVIHPGMWPAVATLALGKVLNARVNRELHDLAPDSEPTPYPNSQRAAKGAAAYVVFVCLLSLNLGLLGVPFTAVF